MKQDIVPSYECKVMEVISGDDLILLVDLNVEDLFKRVRARLRGVDTPSAYRQDGNVEAGRVRADVRKMTAKKQCRIDVHSQGRGGWVVTLFVQSGDEEMELNGALRDMGFIYAPKEDRNETAAQT